MKSLSLPLLFSCLATVAPAARHWTVTETARGTDHRLATVGASAATAPGGATITCDATKPLQEIVGFGGALTESSAWALAQISPEQRAEILHRYFDPKDGIGYTLARTHINSCDFSLHMWALDETPGDYDLHDFTLAPMRTWVMPLLHDAIKASGGKLRILASPWSPPAWMKTNNRMDDGGSLRAEYAPAWAQYFVKFVQAMQREEHIPIWALTVQNEPQAHQTWESCLYSPEQERNFVRDHLGPALQQAGLGGVHLLGLDHNRDLEESFAAADFGDPQASKYFWGLATHWYVSDDFAAASRVHERFPDKTILFTEGCCEGGSTIGDWAHGEHYASQIIGDLRNWVSNFMDWNIVLDERGGPNHVGNFCDAPVIVDVTKKTVTYGPSFYYLGQFSKFIQPGAHRVASTGGPAGLQSVAFVNPDGSIVTVVLNTSDSPVSFGLSAGGDTVSGSIPAHAIQTYVGVSS
ncbi:MAG TPA: glycoside hydrolase family 30 protein [Candidatus Didemnitutus sp.]|nr:glycoside hydrolase family 30 protein [Candidatus Didemnitutus sp.]